MQATATLIGRNNKTKSRGGLAVAPNSRAGGETMKRTANLCTPRCSTEPRERVRMISSGRIITKCTRCKGILMEDSGAPVVVDRWPSQW